MDASSTASAALTLQFLTWVDEGPRTYGEAMEAIWEDAVRDGLVRLENGGAMTTSRVLLTPAGKAVLRKRG
jgi:hypothetical protein